MPTTEARDPRRLAGLVAAFGLPALESRPSLRVSGEEWPTVLTLLMHERLTGLAVAGAQAGWLRLGDRETDQLLKRHRDAVFLALAIERQCLRLVAALEGAGVQPVILKGPALAHTVYPDPSWRSFGDLDLLVRTRDWRLARQSLEELGFHRRLPEPRAGFDERFGKAATHVGPDGLQVDLHRTLVAGPFAQWMDTEELFRWTSRFSLGDRELRRLDDTALLLHACLHASLGSRPPRLLALRDIAQVAARAHVNWEALADLARRWRLGPVLQHGFAAASETLGVRLDDATRFIEALPRDRRTRRALDAYTTEKRQRGGPALAMIGAIPGLGAKARYVHALLVPDREFLAARAGEGRLAARARRLMVPLRWAGRTIGRR